MGHLHTCLITLPPRTVCLNKVWILPLGSSWELYRPSVSSLCPKPSLWAHIHMAWLWTQCERGYGEDRVGVVDTVWVCEFVNNACEVKHVPPGCVLYSQSILKISASLRLFASRWILLDGKSGSGLEKVIERWLTGHRELNTKSHLNHP